jgi:tetratricopeptide (TPR) repeat protein
VREVLTAVFRINNQIEEVNMNYRLIIVLGGIGLLAACGGLPVDWSGDESASTKTAPPASQLPPASTAPAVPENVAAPAESDGAVDQLLGEAMQRRDQGDVEGAISLAERALRIDPRSPRVYYVLGVLQFDKGEIASALQLARKASALDTDKHYQESINLLIEECELATDAAGDEW